MFDRRRRRVLAAVGAALGASLAGCSGSTGGDGTDTTETTGDPSTAETTGDGGPDRTPTTGDATSTPASTTAGDPTGEGSTDGGTTGGTTTAAALDLREANVTAVEFERRDGDYRFSVTLYHDDDGEDGYANWWQVETLAGDRLGRRDLLHAHGTREFTRSETVSIPEGTGTVVVRGHDQTHGYGGQAAVVDLGTGTVEFVRQGPEADDMPRHP